MSLLELREVTVRFGGNVAVDSVSLAVERGVITGLIGPNGAGKTTTFNVITGLQPITSGRVLFDEVDITKARSHKRAQMGIARTFQRLEIFGSLSARDNVLVAAEIRQHWAGRRKARAPLGDEVDELLGRVGISQVAEERADSLPTGLARLVELARALAVQPRLLLLDEPASGLSEGETEAFASLLQKLAGDGLGILLVEHDVPLVMKLCTAIHVLDFGAVLASGTAHEIQANEAVLAAYLGPMAEDQVIPS